MEGGIVVCFVVGPEGDFVLAAFRSGVLVALHVVAVALVAVGVSVLFVLVYGCSSVDVVQKTIP